MKIIKYLPSWVVNVGVTIYNFINYKKRYGGAYLDLLNGYERNITLTRDELIAIQKFKYKKFIEQSISSSKYYKRTLANINNPSDLENIRNLPIVTKDEFRANIGDIYTVTKDKSVISQTGGTTGKSLEVRYTLPNLQDRFALLDNFRRKYGYKLGKKTAWFSGKTLLKTNDIKKNIFWKTDYYHKVRYYSTFHIKDDSLRYYVENLIEFHPEFLVGFPSTMLDIAKKGLQLGLKFKPGVIKAIFPTAETVSQTMRDTIEDFFQSKIYNQYASSEGAPFIFECECGKLHLELQSGVYEVLDNNNSPSDIGRLVVTSFTTDGTPLIRYDINDVIELANSSEVCSCGNANPIVKVIHGRIDDFIFSPEIGKINLGNISNTTKGVLGIIQFQVIQDSINQIKILMIIDKQLFSDKQNKKFLQNWRERVGLKMIIIQEFVTEIEVEKSGKTRIVKNNIKHLINK